MGWKAWFKGLAAAFLGGAAGGAVQAAQSGVINKATLVTALASGLIAVAGYLAPSPKQTAAK